MINTILFDLDGTLLPMDAEKFEKLYFSNAAKSVMDLISPEDLVKKLWGSTKNMVMNTELITNETVFMKDFKNSVGENYDELMKRMEAYYENEFDLAKEATWTNGEIQQAVEMLKEKGYTLVIATNPMFPRVAIEKRIQWTGLNRAYFTYVTSFEDNHYCKPQIQYYEEVLEAIDKKAEECMMVGNDDLEDTISGKLGVTTYLITDCRLSKQEKSIPAHHTGTYKDFLEYAKKMPSLIS